MVKAGDVIYSHTYGLGSLRLRKQLESYRNSGVEGAEHHGDADPRTVEQIVEALPQDTQAIEMVAVRGGRHAICGGGALPDWSPQSIVHLSVAGLKLYR